MSSESGKHIKMAVFTVLGFVACAMLGQQISHNVNPPSGWSPYYWFIGGLLGGLVGAALGDSN